MINKKNTAQVQAISDEYVKLVEREVGATMICMWGIIDPKTKVLATGVAMSQAIEEGDMNDIYFYMQRNLFLSLKPHDKRDL